MTENERFELAFAKTGSINSGTVGRFFQKAEKPSEDISRHLFLMNMKGLRGPKCLILYTDKKGNKIFLIDKEIQSGAVAKSYKRKGFLIYEEIRNYLVIYEEAVSHI